MVVNAGDKKVSSLPFPAIVGQAELKRVLLAVAVNDALDGVLLTGEKGTAKSTAVRSLVDVLPEQQAVADCPYGCSPTDPREQCHSCRNREDLPIETRPVPLVTLPLGATRDRIVGTLSVEDALAGEAEFDPGLLARANRGMLYVDEVNLLDDHLVDVILDAAASGVNTVERDGISRSHPASFTLIGTMNPEEGDLRPQLRDRFSLQATVNGCQEIDHRVEIIDRALSDAAVAEDYTADVADLRERIRDARERLETVSLPPDFKADIAALCLEAGVDGHRGDIATARTAMTLAALDGRAAVIESDITEAATYALPHRLRSTPFEETPSLEDVLDSQFPESDSEDSGQDGERDEQEHDSSGGTTAGADDETGDGETASDADKNRDGPSPSDSDDSESGDGTTDEQPTPQAATSDPASGDPKADSSDTTETDSSGEADETATPLAPGHRPVEIGDAVSPSLEELNTDDHESTAGDGGARANATPAVDNRGARVRTERATGDEPIDAAASVRAATARGSRRVESEDLRQSVRTGEASVTIVFAVDASASMRPAMQTAKGVVLELLRESYENRDEVAFITFAGEDATVLLPPTTSVSLAARHLKALPTGDRTPLPAGLKTAREVIERTTTDAAVCVLLTDGRATVADGSPTKATRHAARTLRETGAHVLVVDAGDDSRAGLSALIAEKTGGELVSLSALSVDRVRKAANAAVDSSD